MVTRWNSKSEMLKGLTAFIAFVLGVSLTLGSTLGVGKMLVSTDKDMEWWRSDWQATTEFKRELSWYLRDFLNIGAGNDGLLWYDMNDRLEKEEPLPGSLNLSYAMDSATPATSEMVSAYHEPDASYRDDENVLYSISVGRAKNKYTNLSPEYNAWAAIPDSYNFQMVFKDGKVAVTKDGAEVDIYGNGIYDSGEEWYVPGYDNFKAGKDVDDVEVRIAVRQIPVQEFGEGKYSSNRIYSLYWEYNQCRETILRLAVMLVVGVALLILTRKLRTEREKVNQRIASFTIHIWTEVRVLLFVGFIAYHVFLTEFGHWFFDIIYLVFTKDQHLAILTGMLLALWPTTPLFCLVWLFWLIHNDHRYNPKDARRGLMPKLRARDLRSPIQKRLRRNSIGGLISMGIILLLSIPVIVYCLNYLMYGWYGWSAWAFIFSAVCLLDIILIPLVYSSWKTLRIAKDIGLLTQQITAIHDGDLSNSIELPKDADLHQAADQLNDIQAGLEKALQDRTQSERMKVELISNVSHDLKTPLTSVLSYAALLEEESLPGAAGDYAQIILEKAKRLDVMVQDVFSISKAASGQLKLTPERLDLGKLLRQTLADMGDAIEKSGLTIKTDIPAEPVEIVADGERLYRVFQNLLQNALQYSIPSSRVYLSLTASTDTTYVMVRNTSATELPTGMDFTARFTRGDESRTDGGAGLGLSIASSFTEACGGKLSVETVADLFTVTVTFPLA